VGPGRGSGAGSLVAYALRITDLDPIPYNLLFERFLNPERVSMPDFDVDFMQERRGEVINYVADKYGRDHVGQIATYAGLNPKSAVKDVARTLGIPFSEINELTKPMPLLIDGKKPDLDTALEYAPKLKELEPTTRSTRRSSTSRAPSRGSSARRACTPAAWSSAKSPSSNTCRSFRRNVASSSPSSTRTRSKTPGLVKFDFLGPQDPRRHRVRRGSW
jgi:DNA polymerase-3 subunit alpha